MLLDFMKVLKVSSSVRIVIFVIFRNIGLGHALLLLGLLWILDLLDCLESFTYEVRKFLLGGLLLLGRLFNSHLSGLSWLSSNLRHVFQVFGSVGV